jgi:hypothetical protein
MLSRFCALSPMFFSIGRRALSSPVPLLAVLVILLSLDFSSALPSLLSAFGV